MIKCHCRYGGYYRPYYGGMGYGGYWKKKRSEIPDAPIAKQSSNLKKRDMDWDDMPFGMYGGYGGYGGYGMYGRGMYGGYGRRMWGLGGMGGYGGMPYRR